MIHLATFNSRGSSTLGINSPKVFSRAYIAFPHSPPSLNVLVHKHRLIANFKLLLLLYTIVGPLVVMIYWLTSQTREHGC